MKIRSIAAGSFFVLLSSTLFASFSLADSAYSSKKPKHKFDLASINGWYRLVDGTGTHCGSAVGNAPGTRVVYELRPSRSSFFRSAGYYTSLSISGTVGFSDIDQGYEESSRSDRESRPVSCAIESRIPGNPSYEECMRRAREGEDRTDTYRSATWTTERKEVIREILKTIRIGRKTTSEKNTQVLTVDGDSLLFKETLQPHGSTETQTLRECRYIRVNG